MRLIVLSAAGLLVSGVALAQAPVYDTDQLPAFHGKVASYSLTPRDEVDGLILDDGTEVHISPRLSSELVFAVKPGDAVTIHGLKANGISMVQALSIANDASGVKINDTVQPANSPDRPVFTPPRMMEARGRVKMALHASDGRVDGALLEDGTIIRFAQGYNPPGVDCIAAGKDIVATGTGTSGLLGRVMETRSIAPDTEASVSGGSPRTVVIMNGGGVTPPGQHLPMFNPPPNNPSTPANNPPSSH